MTSGASPALSLLGLTLRRVPRRLRGKARLARRLMGRGIEARDVVVRSASGARFVVPSLTDSVGFHLFIDGVYEAEEIAWLGQRLATGDVFVDVGANIGEFAVMASRRVGPSGRVIAVEPSPRMAGYLKTNLELNGANNVSVFQVAADATSQESVRFYDAPPERFGTGALTPEYGGHPTLVPARRLDELVREAGVDRVSVLKVDVEGFEERVLRGAEGLLRGPNPPAVLFEFYDWAEKTAGQPGEAQQLLREWGYRIWTLSGWMRNEPPLASCLTSGGGGNLVALCGGQS